MEQSIIKSRQRWVLQHPCRTVQECGQTGYRADLTLGGQPVATVLTIDLFAEPLAWHSTVALIGSDGKAIPVERWSFSDRVGAIDLAKRMLAGVGSPDQGAFEHDALSVGYAYPLTPEELEVVLTFAERREMPEPPRLGEVNEYDFADKKTEVDEGVYAPQHRTLIYERGN